MRILKRQSDADTQILGITMGRIRKYVFQ
jgi:hypothetical protein